MLSDLGNVGIYIPSAALGGLIGGNILRVGAGTGISGAASFTTGTNRVV